MPKGGACGVYLSKILNFCLDTVKPKN